MKKHTFLDKVATIVKGSKQNFGLNPVAELNYGAKVSRVLLHFDEQKLKEMFLDNELGDLSKTKHILKLTNCMSQDNDRPDASLANGDVGSKYRACAFDVILFTLPKDFDCGKGYDYKNDILMKNNRAMSTYGCNWFNATTNTPWTRYIEQITHDECGNENYEYIPKDEVTDGVYSTDTLSLDYDAFAVGKAKYIIARQHFDFGNEDFEFDITEWVNKVLKGEVVNHGLGMAFTPKYELSQEETQQYVGFFTNRTNTFFHPYLETIYEETIKDDRAQFYLGKENRLYFYSVINGEFVDLDELPICEIEGISYKVENPSKGVYFASVTLLDSEVTPNTILYDKWLNLAYNGVEMEDCELEFVALPKEKYFQFGTMMPAKDNLVPTLIGIDDMEKILVGEKRRVIVDCRKKYTTDKKDLIDSADYRIYVKSATREITVFDYTPIEKMFLHNFFYIDTTDLIPATYFVDVRIKQNGEIKHYKERLRFVVQDDVTHFYN